MSIVSPEMIPSVPTAGADVPRDDHTVPAPVPEPQPTPPAESAEPLALPPADFWDTDAGRELKTDRARIESVLGQIGASVADLRKDRTSRIQEWQRAAVELAMTIATRLLHERVASNEFPVDAKVRDMIAQLGEDVPVSVRLNPADLQLLQDRLGGEPLSPGRDDPRFVSDPALDRGAVRVEGRESMLVSDVTRELEEIRDELLRSLGNARS